MFRNPRENAESVIVAPSVGRPPTPPNATTDSTKLTSSVMPTSTRQSSTKPLTPRPNSKTNVPTLGRQSSGKKSSANSKTSAKPNASILSFFKKVDSPIPGAEPDLFINQGVSGQVSANSENGRRSRSASLVGDEDETLGDSHDEEERYHESGKPSKRRKFSGKDVDFVVQTHGEEVTSLFEAEAAGLNVPISTDKACSPPPPDTVRTAPRRIGAFVDDSDSEEEQIPMSKVPKVLAQDKVAQELAVHAEAQDLNVSIRGQPEAENHVVKTEAIDQADITENAPIIPYVEHVGPAASSPANLTAETVALKSNFHSRAPSVAPVLKKEETVYSDFGGFEDLDEFQDDGYAEGEEFVERKWMREQARLEAEENGEDPLDDDVDIEGEHGQQEMVEACPICEAELAGITSEEVLQHVNACLDGKPIPLPLKAVKQERAEIKLMPRNASARFSRSAIPRPGQANPFDFGGSPDKASSSAFSMLMANKAEDVAWATAADAEKASRGKPAYQRTCPFYKIMPGLFVCVDAFRYGAVQGCNAYFLSHFHSDHYIGLTSTWCHGPIFCSKVTGNLVKQQLKVDPKWVVQIEFEIRIEIPGTEGVLVTMIPANHCPGSSLYLFEKVIGKGDSPKVQRILHCGDFRACPAHIAHPLLMPDIVDTITGKTKQQKIDVCYLDTTYLNPRYAFPPQEDVIKACADMCVSLSKDKAEEGDAWEVVKKQRAGAGMVKFVDSASVRPADDGSIAMTANPGEKPRGRLLVVCGTYSIGKERICMGIARALDCKIWAPPGKMRICAALEDPELMSRMTNDPKEAQIHMQMLMEIRAETLQDYLNGYKPHFSRVVGFRPSGWNYRPPNSRFVDSPLVTTVLHSDNWRSRYSMSELAPQRGSTREASCFGVPYSEHSSFRELTMFCCALRIEKIIPTVNVGSGPGRAKMKAWCERWLTERRKNGVVKIGGGEDEVKW